MVEPTCEKLFKFKSEGKPIKYIRCDDGGENIGLMNRLQGSDWQLLVQFEFTGRDTPQRNHLAEDAFATIAGCGRAIMSAAGVPKNYLENFWREAFQTATYLGGFTMVELDNKYLTRFEHWNGSLPRFISNLHEWGEVDIVKLRTSTTPKIYDRGKPCMFVGYCLNHAGDTFRMWDPDTKRVHLSQDIVWTGKMYFKGLLQRLESPFFNDLEDSPNFGGIRDFDDDALEATEEATSIDTELTFEKTEVSNTIGDNKLTTRSGRNIRKPERFRDDLSNTLVDEKTCTITKALLVGAAIGEGIEHTRELQVIKYKDSMNGPDKNEWKLAVKEEHDRMVNNNVWIPIQLNNLPPNIKPLSTTWVLKKKANGQFRARITV
jgi:hypothetical protein